MGAASPSELSLECKPHQSYSLLLKSFGDHHHHQANTATTTPSNSHDLKQLEEILSRLEEERLKIDAFKRELPLSMQLLTTAVEASRQQLQAYRSSSETATNQGPIRPVLEEFIPLKHSNSGGSEKPANSSDKANWMTSVQLWSQVDAVTKPKEQGDIGFNVVSPKIALDCKQPQRSYGGGAFHPFSKDIIRNSGPPQPPLPELALGSPENNKSGENNNNDHQDNNKYCSELAHEYSSTTDTQDQQQGGNNNNNNNKAIEGGQTSTMITNTNNTTSTQNSSHRKARRCWSPDLHRRFVSALQMLGGSQAATPKQIRELMKVDGLTNDEVKSHLQKYRLHTRRPSPSPQAIGGPTPQLVVLGGIWVPPEYANGGHSGPTALYTPASHAPTHYCATPIPQDFYATAQQQQQQQQSGHHLHHQLHHHTLHHQLHVYRASTTSRTQSSPESDMRGNGDRSESIEDGKSESGSWKAGTESGEKGMAARRSEDLEESEGSQITLKF